MLFPRVLSVQSHVVSGYVGNKCSVFPLQLHGFEADNINSVQLSNHLGYNCSKGEVLTAKGLDDLINGLKNNGIDFYSYILTGYIGSKSLLESVKKAVLHFKSTNPSATYVCDPVMGDNGRLYVAEELVEIYRSQIIPIANVVTPNQYEAELLSRKKIVSIGDAKAVMDWFHEKSVEIVVLSSIDVQESDDLICVASYKSDADEPRRYQIRIPKLPVNFTGSGDLFCALFTSWLHKTDRNIKKSLEMTVSTMQAVLTRTYHHAAKVSEPLTTSPLKYPAKYMELKIVQSVEDILSPQVTINATSF